MAGTHLRGVRRGGEARSYWHLRPWASKPVLRGVWGGVLGERLWHLLRGDEIPDLVSARKSLGHSHVLPPDNRAPERAWPILCKLLHKACERLRCHGLLTGSLTLQLAYLGGPAWGAEARSVETDSTLALIRLLEKTLARAARAARPVVAGGRGAHAAV
ncbi:MAG: hypothetical protein WCO57_01580 [Verrucomicrobiota bacterium]